MSEAWQRGYEGRPLLAYPGSDYAKAYAEGKAARKADDAAGVTVVDPTAPQRVDAPPLPQLTDAQIDAIWNRMGSFWPNDHRYFAREVIKAAYGVTPTDGGQSNG